MAMATGHQNHVAAYLLELDGISCGFPHSVGGAGVNGKPLPLKLGAMHSQHVHVTAPKVGEIQVVCGTGMAKQFYDWIVASLHGHHQLKNGAIHVLDFNHKELERWDFFQAQLTQVFFPACDGSSKDEAKLTVRFRSASMESKAGGSSTLALPAVQRQKRWSASNFRLSITGIDCSYVNQVDALLCNALAGPSPHLTFTLPENQSQAFQDWAQNSSAQKNVGGGTHVTAPTLTSHLLTPNVRPGGTPASLTSNLLPQKSPASGGNKNGTLTYLSSDLKTTLFSLNFRNLGVFKVSPDPTGGHSGGIRRVKVELCMEKMDLQYGPGACA